MRDLGFVIVVDGPRLENQGLILATALRRHHPDAAIFGYVTGTPGPVIAALFAAIGGEFRTLPPPGRLWRNAYPHGNKMLALADQRAVGVSVFLDTDMAMVGPLTDADLPGPMQVAVVPEGMPTWGEDITRWDRTYARFGLTTPEERIRLLRGRRTVSPPYFNAGFVAQREGDSVNGARFGALWRDTASEIDHKVRVGAKRPWLDQIALPVTMRRFGWQARMVSEAVNYSISHDRPQPTAFQARILHYHRARFLRAWPGADEVIAATIDDAPAALRAEMRQALTAAGYLDDRNDGDEECQSTLPAP